MVMKSYEMTMRRTIVRTSLGNSVDVLLNYIYSMGDEVKILQLYIFLVNQLVRKMKSLKWQLNHDCVLY
jgi:hypothetical protein